jgi:hypothetical protein
VKVKVDGRTILVDEGVAFAVTRVLQAGYRTTVSCQWEGPSNKKFPAYINPQCVDVVSEFAHLPIGTGKEMADAIGLKKGEYRIYNGVIRFQPCLPQILKEINNV